MLRQHLILAGFILLLSSGQSTIAKTITVPIWMESDGRPRVAVTVEGGQTLDFIIDTGMWETMITSELVAVLAQDEKADNSDHGAQQGFQSYASLSVIIGGLIEYQIDTPEILSAITIPGDTVYGILGSEFLQQYTVGFDVEGGEMILSDEGVGDMFKGTSFSKIAMYSPFANLWMTKELTVGEIAVTAFLDTGASQTIINLLTMESLPVEAVDLSTSEKESLTGASGNSTKSYTAVIGTIDAGTRQWLDTTVSVSDGIFSRLRMGDIPAMVMGSDLLLSSRLIMDYPNGTAYFEDPGPLT